YTGRKLQVFSPRPGRRRRRGNFSGWISSKRLPASKRPGKTVNVSPPGRAAEGANSPSNPAWRASRPMAWVKASAPAFWAGCHGLTELIGAWVRGETNAGSFRAHGTPSLLDAPACHQGTWQHRFSRQGAGESEGASARGASLVLVQPDLAESTGSGVNRLYQ